MHTKLKFGYERPYYDGVDVYRQVITSGGFTLPYTWGEESWHEGSCIIYWGDHGTYIVGAHLVSDE